MILTCSSCHDQISLDLADNWVSIAVYSKEIINISWTKIFTHCKQLLENRTFLCPNCLMIKDIIQ